MKRISLWISLGIWTVNTLLSQPCYEQALAEAEALYQQKEYEAAVNLYLTALLCHDKPEQEDLPTRIKKALNARVQQLRVAIIRAKDAEYEARQLSNKADTLRSYLQGDSTYAVYFKNGKEKFRNGRYSDALRDFAIARFTKDTKDIREWIKITRAGQGAEQAALSGEFNQAFDAFTQLPSLDTGDHRAQRLREIATTRYKWLESIQEKELSTLDTLYLIYEMFFLPVGLKQCTRLNTLYLSENELWKLPPESWLILTQMPNLQTLDLSANRLWCLDPRSWQILSQLPRLRHLVLSDNQLEQLPPQSWEKIPQFSALEILDLSRNALQKIPAEIGQLSHLKKLILIENRLSTDPADWQFLKNLTQLQVVDVRLNHLPPETIHLMSQLLPPNCVIFVD